MAQQTKMRYTMVSAVPSSESVEDDNYLKELSGMISSEICAKIIKMHGDDKVRWWSVHKGQVSEKKECTVEEIMCQEDIPSQESCTGNQDLKQAIRFSFDMKKAKEKLNKNIEDLRNEILNDKGNIFQEIEEDDLDKWL